MNLCIYDNPATGLREFWWKRLRLDAIPHEALRHDAQRIMSMLMGCPWTTWEPMRSCGDIRHMPEDYHALSRTFLYRLRIAGLWLSDIIEGGLCSRAGSKAQRLSP